LDDQGQLVLCQQGDRRIARLEASLANPVPKFSTLADRYEGMRFNSPNDAVFDSRGALYFTDPPYGLAEGPDDPAREMSFEGVFRVNPEGKVSLVTTDLSRPNGIGLSPDEKTLYVANSDPQRAIWMAYDLQPGSVAEGRVFFDATAWVGERPGRVGALINIMLPEEVDRLQRLAVEESPHGIPLLFGRDVIHGLHAVAPIPLAQAATWNLDLVEAGARAAAIDARAYGINWTFAPMVDIARDPRWGRIAESLGEDPFLASRMGAAMVRGWQGDSLQDPTSVAACIKHFAAYGAAEGGRDYNTVSLPETELRNVYLPPFRSAIEAGALSVMSSFNEINGIPATANYRLLTEILREEWGFEGLVVSDWNSVGEMIAHGFSGDERSAARQSLGAGLDMEMMSRTFEDHLAELVSTAEVAGEDLDEAVLRLLRVKQSLGLFERPYRDTAAAPDSLREDSLQVARRLALESAVLLRNTGPILPLSSEIGHVAVVGPLADAPREQLGTWSFDGRSEDSVTPLAALRERLGPENVHFARGLEYSRSTSTNTGDRPAAEVVQLYVRDRVGTRTRPIRELEGFQRHEVAAGTSIRVSFTLEIQDLAFFDGESWVTEPGEFEVWVAPNAASGDSGTFEVLMSEPL
jgi:beta-glucosidase-like glycosyl hydrolase